MNIRSSCSSYQSATGIPLKVFNFTFSLGIITVIFSMIFKWLPDVNIGWRNVWFGGFVTVLLFNLGKVLFNRYVGRSSVASTYGAAGSLVIVLSWVNYLAQILFSARNSPGPTRPVSAPNRNDPWC